MKWLESFERRLGELKEHTFYLFLLLNLLIFAAGSAAVLALYFQWNFLTMACDTALIHNAIVNTLHGHWFRNTVYCGPQILGIHSTFILAPLALVYALIPSVDFLLVLQIAGVYSTAIPFYLIAEERLRSSRLAFAATVVVLTSPFLLNLALVPLHPEVWILPAVCWSYYGYLRNRPTIFWIGYAVAVCCGEPAALIYLALGLSLFWGGDDERSWQRRYAKFALIGGVAWLVFTVAILFPLMRHPQQVNVWEVKYSLLGVHSAMDFALVWLTHPLEVLFNLLLPQRWTLLFFFMGMTFLMAFLSRRTLWLLLPLPLYLLINPQEYFLLIHSYYFVFAFFAAALGLVFFLNRWNDSTRLGVWVLVVSLLINGLLYHRLMFGWMMMAFERGNDTHAAEFRGALDAIPVDAGVYGPHRFSVYLSNRTDFVMGDLSEPRLDWEAAVRARQAITTVPPERIDYIVCDLENDQCGSRHAVEHPERKSVRADNVKRLIASGKWEQMWSEEDVVILRRRGSR